MTYFKRSPEVIKRDTFLELYPIYTETWTHEYLCNLTQSYNHEQIVRDLKRSPYVILRSKIQNDIFLTLFEATGASNTMV